MNFELLLGEEFKNLNYKGYEHYLISNMGRVSYKGKLRKLSVGRGGYLRVKLSSGSERKQMSVHRMVCLTFIGDPEGERNYVNHKNFNVSDNRLENLEWVTPKENTEHFLINKGHKKAKEKEKKETPLWVDVERLRSQSKMANEIACKVRRKKIEVKNISTNKVYTFDSVVEASEKMGLCKKAIAAVARGKRKQHKGYTAEYI